jgi:hypothetical protein
MTDIVEKLRKGADEGDVPFYIEDNGKMIFHTETMEDAAAEIVSLRRQLDEARNKALEEAAGVGYRECAQTRHVRLGDTVAAAIRALKDNQP